MELVRLADYKFRHGKHTETRFGEDGKACVTGTKTLCCIPDVFEGNDPKEVYSLNLLLKDTDNS